MLQKPTQTSPMVGYMVVQTGSCRRTQGCVSLEVHPPRGEPLSIVYKGAIWQAEVPIYCSQSPLSAHSTETMFSWARASDSPHRGLFCFPVYYSTHRWGLGWPQYSRCSPKAQSTWLLPPDRQYLLQEALPVSL